LGLIPAAAWRRTGARGARDQDQPGARRANRDRRRRTRTKRGDRLGRALPTLAPQPQHRPLPDRQDPLAGIAPRLTLDMTSEPIDLSFVQDCEGGGGPVLRGRFSLSHTGAGVG
jgi:hypothetical protein